MLNRVYRRVVNDLVAIVTLKRPVKSGEKDGETQNYEDIGSLLGLKIIDLSDNPFGSFYNIVFDRTPRIIL